MYDHANDGEKAYLGHADNNTIHISDTLLNVGSGKETAAQIASLIEHENGHLEGADEFRSRVAGYSVYARLEQVFGITGEEFDTVTDIAYMTEVLKQYGEEGLFTELFFGDAFDQDNLDGDYYLLKFASNRQDWRQNIDENLSVTLAYVTKEQVNAADDLAKQMAYDRYVEEFNQKWEKDF